MFEDDEDITDNGLGDDNASETAEPEAPSEEGEAENNNPEPGSADIPEPEEGKEPEIPRNKDHA